MNEPDVCATDVATLKLHVSEAVVASDDSPQVEVPSHSLATFFGRYGFDSKLWAFQCEVCVPASTHSPTSLPGLHVDLQLTADWVQQEVTNGWRRGELC